MKKELFFLSIVTSFVFMSCNNHTDRVVAEAYYHKLYASELSQMLPTGLSAKDSAEIAAQYIEQWLMEQVILHEANRVLPMEEKKFKKEIENYKQLLTQQKFWEYVLPNDSLFQVKDEEVQKTIAHAHTNFVNEKEIVKINYVKLGTNSPIQNKVKNILFDEENRLLEKHQLEVLCSDSIEYYIDDDTWLFWEDIQLEVNIDLPKNYDFAQPLIIEKYHDNSCYLIVILDYKSEQTGEDSRDYFESVRSMLIQQRKNDWIKQKMQQLYKQAEKEKKISK